MTISGRLCQCIIGCETYALIVVPFAGNVLVSGQAFRSFMGVCRNFFGGEYFTRHNLKLMAWGAENKNRTVEGVNFLISF